MKSEVELRAGIRAKVIQLSRALGKKTTDIKDDDILLEKGLLDSASVLELIVWLEEDNGVELEPGELSLDNFGSISRMASFLAAQH